MITRMAGYIQFYCLQCVMLYYDPFNKLSNNPAAYLPLKK